MFSKFHNKDIEPYGQRNIRLREKYFSKMHKFNVIAEGLHQDSPDPLQEL